MTEQFVKVPLSEVPEGKGRYIKMIQSLGENEAGVISISTWNHYSSYLSSLKRASKSCGIPIEIRKSGNKLYFWRTSE